MSNSSLLMVAFTPFPAPTGVATRLAQRIAALSRAGWAVDVLTPKTDDLPHVSRYVGSRIFRVPMPQHQGSLPGAAKPSADAPDAPATAMQRAHAFERAVRRQVSGSAYDVIYTLDPFVAPAIESAVEDTAIVYEAAGDIPPTTDPELAGAMNEREGVLLRWCAAVLALSDEGAERVRERGVDAAKVHVVRPSAHLQLFLPTPEGRRWRTSPVRIAVTASYLRPQELSLLAEALLILPTALDVRVTVSAAVTPDARTHILAESVLRDRLALRDPVLYDDLPPLYQEADIGLVVSQDSAVRGRMQAIAEMMASGLAMILPDVPSVREVATHGAEALLVPPADVEALVDAIRTLAMDAATCRRLGAAARLRAERMLDEAAHSRRVVQIVRAIVAEPPEPMDDERPDTGQEDAHTPVSPPPSFRGASSTQSTVRGRSPAHDSRPEPARSAADPHEEVTSPDAAPERTEKMSTASQTDETSPE